MSSFILFRDPPFYISLFFCFFRSLVSFYIAQKTTIPFFIFVAFRSDPIYKYFWGSTYILHARTHARTLARTHVHTHTHAHPHMHMHTHTTTHERSYARASMHIRSRAGLSTWLTSSKHDQRNSWESSEPIKCKCTSPVRGRVGGCYHCICTLYETLRKASCGVLRSILLHPCRHGPKWCMLVCSYVDWMCFVKVNVLNLVALKLPSSYL